MLHFLGNTIFFFRSSNIRHINVKICTRNASDNILQHVVVRGFTVHVSFTAIHECARLYTLIYTNLILVMFAMTTCYFGAENGLFYIRAYFHEWVQSYETNNSRLCIGRCVSARVDIESHTVREINFIFARYRYRWSKIVTASATCAIASIWLTKVIITLMRPDVEKSKRDFLRTASRRANEEISVISLLHWPNFFELIKTRLK